MESLVEVTLLYFDGCPNWTAAEQRLSALADELGLTVVRRRVDTSQEAEMVGFRGSPSILVDGRDVFAEGDEPVGLSCRVYQTPEGPAGAPTVEQLRAVLSCEGREASIAARLAVGRDGLTFQQVQRLGLAYGR